MIDADPTVAWIRFHPAKSTEASARRKPILPQDSIQSTSFVRFT